VNNREEKELSFVKRKGPKERNSMSEELKAREIGIEISGVRRKGQTVARGATTDMLFQGTVRQKTRRNENKKTCFGPTESQGRGGG